MTTSVRNPVFGWQDGHAILSFEFHGKRAVVADDERRTDGWVYLGIELEGVESVELPADPDDGRPFPQIIEGATGDPTVVALARRFFEAVDSRMFKPGPVEPE